MTAVTIAWKPPQKLEGHRALVVTPEGPTEGLPVLYLLHGQFDDETDWMKEEKGSLFTILESCTVPMLIVLPFVGEEGGKEPPLDDVAARLRAIRDAVALTYAPDLSRQGILGISMGGKQTLAFVLHEPARAGFSIVGILSGKFQQGHLNQVKEYAGTWPATFGSDLQLYFHYCGGAPNQPRPDGKQRSGDLHFLDHNKVVAAELAGGNIRLNEEGMHNWNFWKRELKEFFAAVSKVWATL